MKPLFRWTVGACLPQGLDILAESFKRTTAALGLQNFDWMVCYNGLSDADLSRIMRSIGNLPIDLVEQSWEDCPIIDKVRSPKRADGSFEGNGNLVGGSLWKACPGRMRIDSHEIVMDNDILILKAFPQIKYFLNSTSYAIILEEPIRFYGRYEKFMSKSEPFLNSGFMGFPPGYDFSAELRRVWEETGSMTNISQADEQGLLMYTLNQLPSLRVKKTQMNELLAKREYRTATLTGEEEGIHLTQANRIPNHFWWEKYKNL